MIEEKVDLQVTQFFAVFEVFHGLFAVDPERLKPCFKLHDNVIQPCKVLSGVLELAFSFFLSRAVLHNADGFFENFASSAGTVGKDLADTPLPDN